MSENINLCQGYFHHLRDIMRLAKNTDDEFI